jgi:alpha-tubulin suppressor-like RCC1 family protein
VELIQKSLKQKMEQIASTEVEKIACGTLNTVVLTNGGEVYVIGSNTYGQLCKS